MLRAQLNLDNDKQQDFSRLNKLSRQSTMLSSTVATVLAPQWNMRLRRNKREGNGSLDFQGNLQGGANSASSFERSLTSGLQSQQHVPYVRSNTVGWSTRSGPTISTTKVLQSASLDMSSLRMDDKRTDRPIPSPLSPLSPVSPMSIDSNEPQRSPQRGHSPVSSKPTTSSMLLSLRRGNSNTRTSNDCQTQSLDNIEANRQFSTHLTQALQPKHQLSPTSISNKGNPPLSTYGERGMSKSYNVSTVPSKHSESPYSQANPEPLRPQRSYSREHSDSIKLTKQQVTLPKRTPYDHTALLKSHSTPRRTPLSSISWLPQDNQEGSTKISPNENNKLNTPITAPFNNINNPTDNRGFIGQIHNYRDNNNMAESAGKINVNQGGTQNMQNSPSLQSLVKRQTCLNSVLPNPSLPAVLSNSKFSTAPHMPLSHTKGLTKPDASSFTAKVSEFPPTPSLSPKSPQSPPTDISSKFQNMYCTSKSNNASSMAQNQERFIKQSHLHDITNTVTNVATSYKSSLDSGQSCKTSLQPSPVSSQANVHGPTQSNSFDQTPKSNSATPLGFERTYAPKPYQAKTNLNHTVSLYSKSNYSPTFTNSASSASSPSFLSPSVTVSSLLTPPPTPSYTSPSSPELSSPKNDRTFTCSSETKQQVKGELKRARRVTFEDTVDSKPEVKQDVSNAVFARNIKAPSIFSFLRPGNPTPNASPRFSPTPKCSNIQTGGKYRSLSSDSARETYKQLSPKTFDLTKQDLNMPRQERTLSAESGSSQYRSTAALSLPPDFSNGYKNHYSSPPYSTLVSTRTTQGEPPLFQRHSQPTAPNLSTDTTPFSKCPLLPISSLPLRPVQIDLQESLKIKDIHLDQVNNNPPKAIGEVLSNGQIQLVDNRVHISSQSLPGDKSHRSISTCVTEILVYSIRAKAETDGLKNTTHKNIVNAPVSKDLSQQWQVQQDNQSNQSWSGGHTTETNDEENAKRKIREVGRSKFYSIEGGIEQSPKRSRIAQKKSSSTSNATGLSRSEMERTSKSNNKMDQVLNKIKQTFSTRKSANDEDSFPKKWKKSGQTLSVSGMSDVSSASDATIESNRTLEEVEVMELNNNDKGMEDKHRCANNVYTLIPAEKNKMVEDKLWIDTDIDEELSENGNNIHVKIHSPPQDLGHDIFDFIPTNQLPSPNNLSPVFSPNGSSTQFRKSTSSPRSPFSPFGSLSPLSPFHSPDTLEDSVFYSPKPPRHMDSSSSPCELGEISLVASRRSRASTGPPSTGPVTNKDRMSASYADLKYGIEPGRSFSVSSISSSRPSGPGRISTGSRFMSVGDLTKSMTFSCGHTASDAENWTGQYGCQSHFDAQAADSGKMRSRSLPRSFTQNWGTGQSLSLNTNPTWSPIVNDFPWDTEGPPTPPPTPPLSPVTRRMSKPPCHSPPGFSGSPDPPQDSPASRGHLPSRGYTSSLSTFEESSDSSSDTTTDDEYYLEAGEDEEKETEL